MIIHNDMSLITPTLIYSCQYFCCQLLQFDVLRIFFGIFKISYKILDRLNDALLTTSVTI